VDAPSLVGRGPAGTGAGRENRCAGRHDHYDFQPRQMINFLRNLILQDFWLKLFSLTLAVLFWFTVFLTHRSESASLSPLSLVPPQQLVFLGLPVVVMSSAEDVRSVHVEPKEVDVTVQGDPKILKTLQKKDIRVLVDLTGVEAAQSLRTRIDVSTPLGVTPVKVVPENVQVIFPPKG
jgi:YbbR domain-containing protein